MKNKNFKIFFLILVLIFILYLLAITLRSSLIFKKKDRLNLVFYDKSSRFYSIGFSDGVNYFLSFPSDLKVLVPGGFGYYRLGGLGKLVALEKDPDIYRKTFSFLTVSFLDVYFYPKKPEVYFNESKSNMIIKPNLKALLFDKSNVNIFDRLYLIFLFLQKKPAEFKKIQSLPIIKKSNDLFLDQRRFIDQISGFFYQGKIRKERINVQLIYSNSYKNADLITKIIEGEGIWVTDISNDLIIKKLSKKPSRCQIIESNNLNSLTAKYLNTFFNCFLTKGKTEPFDIIFKLGSLENNWAME